ncbi:MAG: sigma-70 family RNA polymerase sigma factor [Clostridia bacterium]|nr:sigma-70 family RNA polymerase sigma factor [Clostridia bacterium]
MLPIYLVERLETEEDVAYVEKIYVEQGSKLFAAANKILHDESIAWGVVHDTVIVLIDYLEEYKAWDDAHQKNFLYKCEKNFVLKELRKRKCRNGRTVSLEGYEEATGRELADETQDIDEWFYSEENAAAIRNAISNMNNTYGDILFFKYFVNMRNKDIAATFGLSVASVNMRVSRAMAMLRKELKGKLL